MVATIALAIAKARAFETQPSENWISNVPGFWMVGFQIPTVGHKLILAIIQCKTPKKVSCEKVFYKTRIAFCMFTVNLLSRHKKVVHRGMSVFSMYSDFFWFA